VAGRALHGYLQGGSSSSSCGNSASANGNRAGNSDILREHWLDHALGDSERISCRELARILHGFLQSAGWAGEQLQQLVLPGNRAKAAAALQGLQGVELQLKAGLVRGVEYCSKECQKADWPRHKAARKRLRPAAG
jgi:hypothetical protein